MFRGAVIFSILMAASVSPVSAAAANSSSQTQGSHVVRAPVPTMQNAISRMSSSILKKYHADTVLPYPQCASGTPEANILIPPDISTLYVQAGYTEVKGEMVKVQYKDAQGQPQLGWQLKMRGVIQRAVPATDYTVAVPEQSVTLNHEQGLALVQIWCQ